MDRHYDFRQRLLIEEIQMIEAGMPNKVKETVIAGIATYFKALKTFGPANPVCKEALKAIREMLKIHKIEDKLLYFILCNLEDFDISATEDAVMKLENLNDATFDSYYGILGEIDTACEEKDKNRQLRPEEGVNSLLTNNRYKTMVLGLTNSLEDIKEYLPYEESFWEYIKPKLRVLHTNGEGARHECGFRLVHDENNKLCDIPVIVVLKFVVY